MRRCGRKSAKPSSGSIAHRKPASPPCPAPARTSVPASISPCSAAFSSRSPIRMAPAAAKPCGRLILDLQDCLSSIERCRKPVLAAIQGACVGGALDLVTCCDMRYAAADAIFSIKEIDLGMVADVGTLQRLPRLIGDGMARELGLHRPQRRCERSGKAGAGEPDLCLCHLGRRSPPTGEKPSPPNPPSPRAASRK